MFVQQGIFIWSLAIKCEQQIISWRHLRVAYCLLDSINCQTLSFKWREIEWAGEERQRDEGRERERLCVNLHVVILVLVRLKLGKEQLFRKEEYNFIINPYLFLYIYKMHLYVSSLQRCNPWLSYSLCEKRFSKERQKHFNKQTNWLP